VITCIEAALDSLQQRSGRSDAFGTADDGLPAALPSLRAVHNELLGEHWIDHQPMADQPRPPVSLMLHLGIVPMDCCIC
jgi:hypothetical protein